MIYKNFLLLLLFVASSAVVFAQNSVAGKKVTDARTAPLSYIIIAFISNSVGIENIFKFILIDPVKRFYYLDNSTVAEWGIRTRVDFNF